MSSVILRIGSPTAAADIAYLQNRHHLQMPAKLRQCYAVYLLSDLTVLSVLLRRCFTAGDDVPGAWRGVAEPLFLKHGSF